MTNNDNPLVSVIIPTYNRPKYFEQTLYSVSNQTYKNIEIIVVDDGSIGSINEIICSKLLNVNYLKIINSGSPCKPRNKGIKIAKGKYIAFIDDDDLWVENRIELLVEILENNPEFGLAHNYCQLIDKDGNDLNKFVGRPGSVDVKHGDVSKKMVGNWTISDYPLIRKEIIDKVGFFNESMKWTGEDVEYWARTSFFTKFYYVDIPLSKYRIHHLNNSEINKKLYIKLNLFLKSFLLEYKESGIIKSKDYPIYIQNVVFNQIKLIKSDYFQCILVLFKLDFFWFLKYRNVKLLIFVLIKR